MKELLTEIRSAFFVTLIFAGVLCGLYPMAVWVIGQTIFPHQTNGSLIVDQGGIVRGSELIGQGFTAKIYFHSRPSAAGNGYDGSSSGGSNLGPTSQKLNDALKDRIALYQKENDLQEGTPVPADAVTASASGLDPHITLKNALIQITRVAKARHVEEQKVRLLIDQSTDANAFGILGESGVNVLKLNLALDSIR